MEKKITPFLLALSTILQSYNREHLDIWHLDTCSNVCKLQIHMIPTRREGPWGSSYPMLAFTSGEIWQSGSSTGDGAGVWVLVLIPPLLSTGAGVTPGSHCNGAKKGQYHSRNLGYGPPWSFPVLPVFWIQFELLTFLKIPAFKNYNIFFRMHFKEKPKRQLGSLWPQRRFLY